MIKSSKYYLIQLSLCLSLFFLTNCNEEINYLNIPESDKYDQILSYDSCDVNFVYDSKLNPKGLKRGFQGIPSIGYKDGIYFSAWMCGRKGEEPGNYMSLSVSTDNGNSWLLDKLLIVPQLDSSRHIDPSFWIDQKGELNLSWTYVNNGYWDGGNGGLWYIKIKYEKNKILITKPQKLGIGVMNIKPSKAFNPKNNTIYYPMYCFNLGNLKVGNYLYWKATRHEYNSIILYKTTYDYRIKTISKLKKVSIIPSNFPRTFDEPMVVDLGSDSLICYARTNSNGIVYSISKDNGLTWSIQKEFKSLGLSPSSRFFCGRLNSGNLLFILNNSTERKMMTAYLSTDNGKSWPHKLNIDIRDNSYPDVVQDNDNNIALIYDRSRPYLGQIIFTKFSENDIIQGKDNNIKLITISSLK